MKQGHNCDFFEGRIKDVLVRGGDIYCRRCYRKLNEDEIDIDTLREIKQKLDASRPKWSKFKGENR